MSWSKAARASWASFLARDLADELNLAVAPFFVADPDPKTAPASTSRRPPPVSPMTLAEVSRVGEVGLLRYLLGPGGPDHRFLRWAVELSRLCPPSDSAFSVGAVIVGEDGEVLATGFSREQEDHDHAEEVALRKLAPGKHPAGLIPALGPDPRLRHATIYSSLVPCGARASRPVTCVQHIVAAGIPRVVFAWREPRLFTGGEGAEQLRAAGVAVTEVPGLAERARRSTPTWSDPARDLSRTRPCSCVSPGSRFSATSSCSAWPAGRPDDGDRARVVTAADLRSGSTSARGCRQNRVNSSRTMPRSAS